ncbi:MAG: sensor histidine kinase [Pseudorhodoplanes sp.]
MRDFRKNRYFMPALTALLTAGTFVLDIVTDVDTATAVLYIVIILLSASFAPRRTIIWVGVICAALTLTAFLVAGSPTEGLMNCVISLSAIGAMTYLALKIKAKDAAEREVRNQLAHVARITMLGELATLIAHEVNQPLAAVMNSSNASLNWLSADPPNVARARQGLDRVLKDATRASEIIARVRALAAPAPPRRHWVSINGTIDTIVSFMRSEIEKNRIALRLQLDKDLPRILADGVQLQQVLLNLVMNSIESLGQVPADRRVLSISSTKLAEGAVQVAVSDSGKGIDAAVVDKLFDAFHTTKEGGLGMGLAISRSIIEAHGGTILVDTHNKSSETIFTFKLPIAERAA